MTDAMYEKIKKHGRPLSTFHKGDRITVSNKMVKNYSYTLSEDPGDISSFHADFKPYASPGELLSMGVFEGKYLNDSIDEFPAEWFMNALALDTLRPDGADVSVNAFRVGSRQPLLAWRKAGWVPGPGAGANKRFGVLSDAKKNPDERGWFQWYCRYWMGRRINELDAIQIKRWKAFTRHEGQIRANCKPGDVSCRPVQRQGLLQWAHNPFI